MARHWHKPQRCHSSSHRLDNLKGALLNDTTLHDLVLARLEKDTQPADEWSALVLAALEGPEALLSLLDEPPSPEPEGESESGGGEGHDGGAGHPPATAFLRRLTAQGFRGIGPKATLDLTPGPGLTLVVGRNGSGKSSFAEGLELLLTGDTYRWSQRSKVWRDGWRNLHHPKAALAAEFALEGERGACTLAREWADGADLADASTWAQVHGQPRTGPEALGWETPLEAYRPFLSYNELGSLLDEGPSKLYDALSKVLGLDALVDAQTALQQARSARDKARKDADQERKALLARLEDVEDERAQRVKDALGQKDWGLEALEAELTGSPTAQPPDSQIDLLKRLAALQAPDKDAVTQATQALRDADQRQKAAAQTVAGKSDQLATLLDHALRFHKEHGDGDCPVCGNKGGDERRVAPDQGRRSRNPPTGRQRSHRVPRSPEASRHRASPPPHPRHRPPGQSARSRPQPRSGGCAESFRGRPLDRAEESTVSGVDLANAIDQSLEPLTQSLTALRQAAATKLAEREDAWRPHALALAEWLPKAHQAQTAADSLKNLKPADKWLKAAADTLRNDRFAPIADETRRIWDQLRLQSNVSLDRVSLITVADGKTRVSGHGV